LQLRLQRRTFDQGCARINFYWRVSKGVGKRIAEGGSDGYILDVTALEQIQKMPFNEKLRIMEAIWDDISRAETDLEVAQWHKELLDERERLIAEGKARFLEWDDAKKKIKEATERGFRSLIWPRTTSLKDFIFTKIKNQDSETAS
jgi:hypothetical protein